MRGEPAAPNGPLVELALGVPREDAAPSLELVDVARRLAREDLDRVLVAEVVGALDGVEGVRLGVVVGLVAERGVDASLGRARVAAGRVQLRDDRNPGAGIVRLDGSAHARAARADHEHVEGSVHRLEPIGCALPGPAQGARVSPEVLRPRLTAAPTVTVADEMYGASRPTCAGDGYPAPAARPRQPRGRRPTANLDSKFCRNIAASSCALAS